MTIKKLLSYLYIFNEKKVEKLKATERPKIFYGRFHSSLALLINH